MRSLCLIVCLLLPVRGEIIDRLAVAVGNQVITELQLDEEMRVTAMLNHASLVRSVGLRQDAADRLVEQLLIEIEMNLSHYALPDTGEVDKYYRQIQEGNGGAAETNRILSTFNLTPEILRRHLKLQLTELKFIEVRFRPDATVSDAEVDAAYLSQVTAWKQTHTGQPPTLESSRESLYAILREQHTDAALNKWLAESRKRVAIVYLDKTLQ